MNSSGVVCATALACWLVPVSAWAQAQAPQSASLAAQQALQQEIEQVKREFEARIAALEAKFASASGGTAPATAGQTQTAPAPPTAQVPPGAEGGGGPSGPLPVYGGAAASSKIFNPDMAVIGNFLGVGGKNTINPSPSMEMRESEVSLQAIVDPYARADFFLAFGEEGVDLEEGFVTFPSLPGGLLMKVGKLRAAFGKVNPSHTHILPWADRPLVTQNLVGGEEGISDAGFSVAKLIPNRWVFLEATGEVFRGDAGDIFQTSQRQDLSYFARLRGYHDLSESTNLDLGALYGYGHNASGVVDDVDVGQFTTQLVGFDATLRWRPLRRSIYRSFIARAEGVFSRRDQPNGEQRASGFYVSGDYQLARRWFTGVRYDASDRAGDAAARDVGQSITLTFWPSEFSQVRGQYRRTQYAEGTDANEFLLQFQFGIGAHSAHPF